MAKDLRKALWGKIPDNLLARLRSFDLVGDIAVLKLPNELHPYAKIIGEALMQVHHHVRVVLNQVGPVSGDFRTRQLDHVAGEKRTVTTHRENGCLFKIDLARAYFSPRLGTERLRITRLVHPREIVTNLFAGVGCYSIEIARHSSAKLIYSIDLNPAAYELMVENIRINKVGDRVIPILGDARKIVDKQLSGKADRVLMPLPEFGRDFFSTALAALKPSGGVVHYYDYGNEPNPFVSAGEFIKRAAAQRNFAIKVLNRRKVRSYAPRCHHIVLDIKVKRSPEATPRARPA